MKTILTIAIVLFGRAIIIERAINKEKKWTSDTRNEAKKIKTIGQCDNIRIILHFGCTNIIFDDDCL
jgi:hypothetical protein